MPLFASHSLLQQLGDLVVVMCMVGLAIFGWYRGLFLATLVGLQVLASSMLALAFAARLTPVLLAAECPPQAALAVSFLIIFLGSVTAIHLAIGAAVPEGAVRFSDAIDRFGGTCIGVLAGSVVAGALLVAWSMAELPEGYAVRAAELKIDPGSKIIHTFARCVGEDGLAGRLLECYDACDWKSRPVPAAEGPPAEHPADAPVPAVGEARPAGEPETADKASTAVPPQP